MTEWYLGKKDEEVSALRSQEMFTVEDIVWAFKIAWGGLKDTNTFRIGETAYVQSAANRAKAEAGEYWQPGPRAKNKFATYDRAHTAAILDVLMGIATNPHKAIRRRSAGRGFTPESITAAEEILLTTRG